VVADVDGSKIFARARFEDIAGNISDWYSTDGISIDLSKPVAGPVDDVAGNNDPDEHVSTDASIRFNFSHSDAVSGVVKVRVEVARDAAFTDSGDQAGGSWFLTHGFLPKSRWVSLLCQNKGNDRSGWESTWVGSSNGIRLNAALQTGTQACYILTRELAIALVSLQQQLQPFI
jgi:hypothetical protein